MGTRRKKARTPGVVGYLRVSTTEQGVSGLGVAAQRTAIEAEAARRGLSIVAIYEDCCSGKKLDRPGLNAAREALTSGEGTVLVASKMDRLSRSVHDVAGLLLEAERAGWGLVALDLGVDTTTPNGAAMAQMAGVFGELERKMIGQRTRDALAAKKAQGFKLGGPVKTTSETIDRICTERLAGAGWSTIARGLDADQVPTSQGGSRWWPSAVRACYLANIDSHRR